MMEQRVDQSPAIALVLRSPGSSVYHHSRRVIDRRGVVIFIDDVERNLFGNSPQGRPLRLSNHADALATPQLQRGLGRHIVHQYFSLGDQLLDSRPAHIEHAGQILIEALTRVFRSHRDRNWRSFSHLHGTILLASPQIERGALISAYFSKRWFPSSR